MADRSPGTLGGDPIAVLADAILVLQRKVAALEARQARSLPGDYRFVAAGDGSVSIERVSTGGDEAITGPL